VATRRDVAPLQVELSQDLWLLSAHVDHSELGQAIAALNARRKRGVERNRYPIAVDVRVDEGHTVMHEHPARVAFDRNGRRNGKLLGGPGFDALEGCAGIAAIVIIVIVLPGTKSV
jgi:hypothetical protein